MQIYEELKARGLIAQVTDEEEIRELVNNGKAIGDCMDLSTADRLMIQVPMFHCFGMVLAMTAAMAKAEEDNIDFNTPGAWEQVYEQVMEGAR